MRTNPKHDNTCWTRFGMFGIEKCYGCTFESECELLPDDTPYFPLRPPRPVKKRYGRTRFNRVKSALEELKHIQNTFTISAITVRTGIPRRSAAEYVKDTQMAKRIKKGSSFRESVWEFV